jgi:cytochrome c biogenesis protein ResB
MHVALKALKSMRLALVLIAYIAVTGILASLLPQGRESSFYYSIMPAPLARLVLFSGFDDFYGSLPFLIPALLFFANLAACSADRFSRELKKGKARRHGPDIIHLGLILLLLGAVFGQVARQTHPSWQGFARLGNGDAARLPDGRLLVIKSLQNLKYPDGRDKDWISTVEVSEAGKTLISSYEIRVNHPLRMGSLSIFQAAFGSERVLELTGPAGSARNLAVGEYIDAADGRLTLTSIDPEGGTAIASEEGAGGSKTISLVAGSEIGSFTVEGVGEAELSGLRVTYNPFYPVILAAFAIVGVGVFITFARKLGELEA